MNIFAIRRNNCIAELSWRVSEYHAALYHGSWRRPATDADHTRRPPALNTTNREALVGRRSGRINPDVFFAGINLSVSGALQRELSRLPNTAFLEMTCDAIVDLPMPAKGDLTWIQCEAEAWELNPAGPLEAAEASPQLTPDACQYWEVLAANIYDESCMPLDVQAVRFNFGSYATVGPGASRDVMVSREYLEKYPIVWSGHVLLREDAFKLIAPRIDRDYIDVAWIHLTDS